MVSVGMLLFVCEKVLTTSLVGRRQILLRQEPESVLAECGPDEVLVISALSMEDLGVPMTTRESGSISVPSVPESTLINKKPRLPVLLVEAAGGVITRSTPNGPELLLIHRRGVWDLPKGKRDEGETIEETGLREVREEVGVKALEIVRSLTWTTHAYRAGGHLAVKKTYWYLMATPEREFVPQQCEGIKEVRWFSWQEAIEIIGYPVLRRLLERVRHETLA